MNMFMVDVTDIPGVRPEDEVVLLGRQKREAVSAEELAGHLDTINYEVVTRVNPRLPRVIVP
jgi:alanine racemase